MTRSEETSSSISQEQSTQSSQDAMRTRVRLFAEGVVKMVSPVLLALALRKVDLKDEGKGTWFVRGCISPIAAVTLAFGILLVLLLWLCLSKLIASLEWLQDAASKLLVHLCAILLVFLAYDILLLISMDYKGYMVIVLPLVFFIMMCYIYGAGDARAKVGDDYDRDLENSVDFSASLTVLLFLGLERLALELHLTSNEGMPHDHLESCLALSFVACVIGVVVSLVWTMPPSIKSNEGSITMRTCVEVSNVLLALLITAIVVWITWAPLKTMALCVIIPPLLSLFCGIYLHMDYNKESEDINLKDNATKLTPDDHVVDIIESKDLPQQSQCDQADRKLLQAHQKSKSIQPSQQEHIEDVKQQAQPLVGDQLDEGDNQQSHQNLQMDQHCHQKLQGNPQCAQVQQPQDEGGALAAEDNQVMAAQDVHVVDQQEQLQDDLPSGQTLGAVQQNSDQQVQIDHQSLDKPQPNVNDEVRQDRVRNHLTGNQEPQENSTDTTDTSEVKPPSLELTKFALAGFLAVSIPSISDCSQSNWTHAFIFLTALSVVSALVWRLLGHRAKPTNPEVVAANIVSISAHASAIAALIPFAVIADMNARLAVAACPHK